MSRWKHRVALLLTSMAALLLSACGAGYTYGYQGAYPVYGSPGYAYYGNGNGYFGSYGGYPYGPSYGYVASPSYAYGPTAHVVVQRPGVLGGRAYVRPSVRPSVSVRAPAAAFGYPRGGVVRTGGFGGGRGFGGGAIRGGGFGGGARGHR